MADKNVQFLDHATIRKEAELVAAKNGVTDETGILVIYQAICIGINMGLEKAQEVFS